MIGQTSIATRAAIVASMLAGFSATAVLPAAAQSMPQGWFKVCAKQEDNDICNVQNITMAETGQLVIGVSMIEVKGKVNRKVFQISVPPGRLIPPGISLSVDGAKPQKLDFVICFPDRCVAEAPLDEKLVGTFKKGGEVILNSINFQNQPNPIKISLKGFGEAYDGEGLKQSDLEQRQQTLQDEIQKRRAEFEKKLKEEQDKAKTAN
ncbi:MAG: invasion associated locus B family protein [Phyllobacteriaceae bacterium]|nr:invasion associated locus B family protein [Phyllobacteriaceae bacterium]